MLDSPCAPVTWINLEIALNKPIRRGRLVRNAIVARINPHHLVDVVLGSQRGSVLSEDLCRPTRAELTGNSARVGADFHFNDGGRADEITHRHAFQCSFHHVVPNGTSAAYAAHALHRTVIRVAKPYSQHDVRRVANGPVVTENVGGPRLDRRRARQVKHTAWAKGRGARPVVGQDMGDKISVLRA